MTEHDNIEEIRTQLPWYVNGTLDKRMTQAVEKAIASSPALKAEVAWLQSVQSNIKADEAMVSIPDDIGMAQFKALIANEQSGKVTSLTTPSRWQQWQRPLMAVAATVIVVQMGVIGTLMQPEETGTSLTTLSGSTLTIDQGALLQVVFSESATELGIRNTLNKVQGEIVSGPGAMGIYTVLVDSHNITNTIKQLQSQSIVESVNPLKDE